MNYFYKLKKYNRNELFFEITAEYMKHKITGLGYDPELTKQHVTETLLTMVPEIEAHVSNSYQSFQLNAFKGLQNTCKKFKFSQPQMLTFRIKYSSTSSAYMSICRTDQIKESGIGRTPKQAKDQAACKLIHLILKKIEKEKNDKLQNNFQNLTVNSKSHFSKLNPLSQKGHNRTDKISNVKQINNLPFKKRIRHNLPIQPIPQPSTSYNLSPPKTYKKCMKCGFRPPIPYNYC